MTQPYTIVALDVGDVRIGVAAANSLARLPRPLTTITRSDSLWDDLARIVKSEDAREIVVGLPRNQQGEETLQTAKTRDFIIELEAKLNLPIFTQDESLTSVKAEQELSKKGKFTKSDVDALAATYILEDYLADYQEKM